jgi:hypothetical protein
MTARIVVSVVAACAVLTLTAGLVLRHAELISSDAADGGTLA